MSKLFGEYLIEKKIISEENLVQLIVQQSKSIPSLIQLVHKSSLINPKDMLAILRYQTQKNISFEMACKNLNFWNEKLESTLNQEYEKYKIPIVQLIIENELADTDQVMIALEEYLNQKKDEVVESNTQEPSQASNASDSSPQLSENIEAPKTEENITSNKKVSIILMNYYLTPSKKLSFEKSINTLMNTADDSTKIKYLNKILSELYTINGLFKFSYDSQPESSFESYIKQVETILSQNNLSEIDSISKSLLTFITDIWNTYHNGNRDDLQSKFNTNLEVKKSISTAA